MYEGLLRKEYELGYMLEHPNIRRTYSFGNVGEIGSAIIMEYIAGRTLRQYMNEEGHSTSERKRITIQLCEALSFAHRLQVTHRDLKPENIMITYNGDNVKIIDFGLSDSDSHTRQSGAGGTMRYASPELLCGDEVDCRSDIYSLGIIMDEFIKSRAAKKIAVRCMMPRAEQRPINVDIIAKTLSRNPNQWIYISIFTISIIVCYLFYTSTQTMTKSQYSEVLIPSAVLDNVSDEEFARRQAISNKFYGVVNNRYLELIQRVNTMNYTTRELPDFDRLSQEYSSMYQKIMDSMLADIKSSSLYTSARRNLASHNSELITIARNGFPAMFWLQSENLFRSANDPLAEQLKSAHTPPKLSPNYSKLSYEEQLLDTQRYNNELAKYHISTLQVWAVEQRKLKNLDPLPQEVINYYKSLIKE